MYELQLFDPAAGRYVPQRTGAEAYDLLRATDYRGPRRVVDTTRGTVDEYGRPDRRKPLPLKPQALRRSWRKYKLGTVIEPAPEATLLRRATAHYVARAEAGERDIKVYLWSGSTFGRELRLRLRSSPPIPREVFQFIELDPDEPGSPFADAREYPEVLAA